MTDNDDPVIELRDVVFSYGKGKGNALAGVNLKIRRGSRTAVIGANGAGKSTMFWNINGIFRPDSGTVLYEGKPLSYRHRALARLRSEVSVLFQNPDEMLFKPTVGEDVAFGPENMRLPKAEVESRVDTALRMVGMEEYRDRPVMKLSYGQRKRVAIAGVIAMRPKVLIMDEPTAGLDPQMASEVMEIARQLNVSGVTVVMASHDTDLIYSWAEDICVMRHGKCVYCGDPDTFFSDGTEVYLAGLMPPRIFQMNKGLCDLRGQDPAPYPRTEAELVCKTVARGERTGTFNILPVPEGCNVKDVKDSLEKAGLLKAAKGIYGKSARCAEGLITHARIDYIYGGADSCMVRAMEGDDTVLFCDPEMVDDAISLLEFAEKSGWGKIESRVLPPAEHTHELPPDYDAPVDNQE